MRVTAIAIGCGLTWVSAAVGIGLAVRLHDRLCEANVVPVQVAASHAAPVASVAATVASEEQVPEPVAESPADEDNSLAAAWSPRARVLRLHPLEGPFAESDRTDLEDETFLDLPPAGIPGLRALKLGWSRDGAVKLLVLLSTPAHEYGREIVTDAALPDPAWAAFDTLPMGDTLVIAIGWGVMAASTFQQVACEHYTLSCRIGDRGVPACAPPVLVARAPRCSPEGFGAGLPVTVPPIQRRRDYNGDLVLVDGVTFDLAHLALSPLQPAAWNRKTSDFQAHELGPYSGIGAVRLFTTARLPRRRIGLTTSRGEFVGRLGRSRRSGVVGWSSQWVKRGVLLIGWTVGVGIVDPPDSTYSACEQSFVVCRMDAHDVPWCSDAITLARAAKCVEGDTGLDDAPSAPSWAPDGRTFRIEGRRFRIEAGGWDK